MALPDVCASTADQVVDASRLGVYDQVAAVAARWPTRTAIETKDCEVDYATLLQRVDAVAGMLVQMGVKPGDRVAVLSKNCIQYIEILLAAGKIGVIVACQNWRLTSAELQHCIDLVEPVVLVCSPDFAAVPGELEIGAMAVLMLGEDYESRVERSPICTQDAVRDLEAGLLILYTSGTTGRAKAALISQRALCWRMCLLRMDLGVDSNDAYLAWSPMFHMGGSEHSLSTLIMGGRLIICDGFDPEFIARIIATRRLGWLLLVPATIDPVISAFRALNKPVLGIKAVGSMADLIPAASIAELTRLLNAPFFNSFGSTETGLTPASGGLIPAGICPESLSKSLSSLCAMRIVSQLGEDVPVGEVGEAWIRSPALFSGYWNNDEINQRDFSGGWFRMGDLFRSNSDGSIDFVGRAKYLIKSGGENIYPAEIEQVLLSDSGVKDAIVVRQPDSRWGEVPVAVVSISGEQTSAASLAELCRVKLAAYKQPRHFHLIDFNELPRSATGKIVREELEEWLQKQFP